MADLSRRSFVRTGTALAGVASAVGLGVQDARAAGPGNGFMAASATGQNGPGGPGGPGGHVTAGPGIQRLHALCEVTGGGQKVYGIAVEYDADIDAASLALDTYAAAVVPVAKGFFA